MVRQTSIQTYHKIMDDGLLSLRRGEVYEVLFRIGPATASEVFNEYLKTYGKRISTNGSGSRLSELRDCGVVQELGTKACSITGHNVILWDVTDQLPVKPKKSKTEFRYWCDECDRSFDNPLDHDGFEDEYCSGILTQWRKVK